MQCHLLGHFQAHSTSKLTGIKYASNGGHTGMEGVSIQRDPRPGVFPIQTHPQRLPCLALRALQLVSQSCSPPLRLLLVQLCGRKQATWVQ